MATARRHPGHFSASSPRPPGGVGISQPDRARQVVRDLPLHTHRGHLVTTLLHCDDIPCPPGTTATPVMLYTQHLSLAIDVPLDAVHSGHRVGFDGEFAAGQALHVACEEVHHIGRAGHRRDR